MMKNKTIEEYLSQKQAELVIYSCEKCGKHVEKSGRVFRRNPHLYCKSCYMVSKYGTTCNAGRKEVREKIENTINTKYGSREEYYKRVTEKIKETSLKKYGVDNCRKVEEIKKKIVQSKDYKKEAEKRKQTNLEKYGAPSIGKNTHIYKGIHFDSSWELAFWIWCEDNNLHIERNTKAIHYKNKNYYPDFIVDGRLYEIKGDHLTKKDDWVDRSVAYLQNNVKVLFFKDVAPILKYIYSKYGKEYLKKFKRKTKKSFKRTPTEENEKPKKHHRIHYTCKNCGCDVFATVFIYKHFNDGLCKTCRLGTSTN